MPFKEILHAKSLESLTGKLEGTDVTGMCLAGIVKLINVKMSLQMAAPAEPMVLIITVNASRSGICLQQAVGMVDILLCYLFFLVVPYRGRSS